MGPDESTEASSEPIPDHGVSCRARNRVRNGRDGGWPAREGLHGDSTVAMATRLCEGAKVLTAADTPDQAERRCRP